MELKELIKYARDNRCSDLHITAGEAVAVRKYGELELLDITPSIEETEDMIFSILGDEDIQNVQAGKDIDVASTDESGGRLRINIYHQRRNLAASIRLLDSVIPSFEELGHSGKLFSKLVEKRSGLILVTGPTGSGKSTTLAAMIDYINNNMSRHIITVEDPIEYVYGFKKSMIHQRQVGRDVPDFATALRSALREDPDVILVGEMRDYETINAAITAAETGHLVFSTLHTIGAAATIDRIIDVFPTHQQQQIRVQLSMVLEAVISQQLIPTADHKRRVAAFEVMITNPAIKNLIREGKTYQIQSMIQTNKKLGMQTMDDALYDLYRRGEITGERCAAYAQDIVSMDKRLRGII